MDLLTAKRWKRRRDAIALIVVVCALSWVSGAGRLDPIVYTIRAPAPETHLVLIEARFPTDKRTAIELMMPVWSPGFYRVEDYAGRVQDLQARAPDGAELAIVKPQKNRWKIETRGARTVVVSYKLTCEGRSVTGSWVSADYAVFNGPSTFITLVERARRPHEVHLELPPGWKQSATSLDAAPDRLPNHYRAPDYDVFADSPIVAGTLSVHEFEVAGSKHYLVDFGGDRGQWDGQLVAQALQKIVAEHRQLLGGLPFKKYVFLNAFRQGGGGLEDLNSTLLTSGTAVAPQATSRWLKYVSHEYFHAFNVKRLRPIELGPFDYDNPPHTPSLWIAEGLTTYYGDLAVVRSGVGSPEDFWAGKSAQIRQLQTSPGRLVQTLEQSSLEVWGNSTSGVGGNRNTTVSYYVKGDIVGLLLDAQVRRVTNGSKSLDDVMRLAYRRYSGARGFRPEEFQATAAEVAGVDLKEFFRRALSSTEELDYQEMLDWFGLRFSRPEPPDPAKEWTLEVRTDASNAQKQHLANLLAPTGRRH